VRELYSHRYSLIHQMDARVKVIFTLAFILFLSLSPFKAWPAYILYFSSILSLVLLSRLGVRSVLKRALLALPFVMAAAPLIFTGPPPYIAVPLFHGIPIHYSPEGCLRFVSISIKAWISMQAAILLAATTPFPDLLQALSQLKVPKLFVAITGLMWRYLFVIGDEVNRMLCARSSRSAKAAGVRRTGGTVWWRARVTGGMAGSLFLRSLERSDRVYAAMLSRGYTGELPDREAAILSPTSRRTLFLGIGLIVLIWILGILSGG
jgi:cobalt/nickel transport system permease protein